MHGGVLVHDADRGADYFVLRSLAQPRDGGAIEGDAGKIQQCDRNGDLQRCRRAQPRAGRDLAVQQQVRTGLDVLFQQHRDHAGDVVEPRAGSSGRRLGLNGHGLIRIDGVDDDGAVAS